MITDISDKGLNQWREDMFLQIRIWKIEAMQELSKPTVTELLIRYRETGYLIYTN